MKNIKNNEYISVVGHELRTPLTSIRGYLSMVLEGDMGEISNESRKALNHCYDSSVRLINLVNDVLALSKIESGRMEYYMIDIDITELLKYVYKDTFIEAESKGVGLEIEIDKELKNKMINVDSDKLRQVFINLINNAIKFTDIGGKIIIKATKKTDKVLFEVIDNGIGIPKEKLETLFDKFTQVESSLQRENTSGLGLGLTLCKSFINNFGSDIIVHSQEGKGSTFSFELSLVK